MIENRLKFREMKSMESGRTMVEILAVLAIMGVLTLGAVMGYRYAIDKLNANDIIDGVNKRAAVAAPQRVLHQPINLTEFHPDTCMQIPRVEIEDQNGINHACNDPDIITLPAISGTNTIEKNIAKCEQCPNREFVDEIYCAPRCRACDPARVLTGGERYCRLEVCASDYYLSSDNTKCISCTTTEAVDVMNNETMRERCLACTDDNGNKMRRLNGQWCVLASQCPYGTQEDDPSTSDVDESIYCAECPENTFPAKNQCVSCDDRMWHDGVTSTDCTQRCGGKRYWRSSLTTYEGYGKSNICMLVKGEGEFYSSHGTQSCELKSLTRDLGVIVRPAEIYVP